MAESTSPLDEIDRTILQILQVDGRIPNTELARRIHLSPPATHLRVKRLEAAGYLTGYVALVDRERLGLDLLCFIHISLQLHQQQAMQNFLSSVREMDEVLACYHVTGEYDYLLKVALANRERLQRFIVEKLIPIPGVERIYTSLALAEIKSTTAYPLDF